MLALYALAFALLAVSWAVILVDTGMLLQPVQRWVRAWYVRYRVDGLLRYIFKDEPNPDKEELADTRKGIEANPQAYGLDLDSQWWWKPLWGCYRCVAGQFGFWGYLLLWWRAEWSYGVVEHLVFTCLTIFLACVLARVYRWTQE